MPNAQERDISLDLFRGLLIAAMVLAHMRGYVLEIAVALHGFSSIPEYFYMISGLVVGRTLPAALAKYGPAAAYRKAWRRAVQIYLVHIAPLLLVAAATLAVPGYMATAEPALGNFAEHPWRFVTAALLLYQPGYFDILPIFILFAFLGPWTLLAKERRGWAFPLAVSVVCWGLGQAGPTVDTLTDWIGRPEINLGDFTPHSVQLVFVAGVLLGEASLKRRLPLTGPMVGAAAAVWLGSSAVAHGWIAIPGFDPDTLRYARGNLHAVRVVDIVATSILVWASVRWLPSLYAWRTPVHAALALLGREGMLVFALHLGCTYWVGMQLWDLAHASRIEHAFGPRGLVLTALSIEFAALFALIGVAWLTEAAGRSRRLRNPNGAVAPV